jgi:perosamine synthetase
MYCQGLDCGPVRMLNAMVRGGSSLEESLSWPQFHGRHAYATHQARSAIAFALRQWNIGAGDEVLVPAYNCGTDVDPVFKSGAGVRTYRIGSDLQLDMADIRRLCTPRTRLIYVIHYFGWPQELVELRQYCDGAGIKLLEDCALALFGRGPDGWLGQQGDGAVFSLPKMLAVPDGGILLLKQPSLEVPKSKPPLKKIVRQLLPLGKRFLFRKTSSSGLYRLFGRHRSQTVDPPCTAGDLRPDIPRHYYFNPATTDWGMSRITKGLLSNVNPGAIIERRRRNYLRLLGLLEGLPGLQPVFCNLPSGVCPIGLPILVDDRGTWEQMLSAHHIDVYSWWSGYHSGVQWDRFPEACRLKDRILLLPIHQQLDDRHMEYIGRQVAVIADAKASNSSTICGHHSQSVDQIHAA